VLDTGEADVLHDGNFQGQQVALAADASNEALTQASVLAERQLDVLLSPDQNGCAPPPLAWEPGLNSGFEARNPPATALVVEMRNDAQMAATSSIPTNGDNPDIVSMGPSRRRLVIVAEIGTETGVRGRTETTSLSRTLDHCGTASYFCHIVPATGPARTDRLLVSVG